MPLVLAALLQGLPGAADAAYFGTRADAARAWADAVGAYAAGIVPASTSVATARIALEPAILTAFATYDEELTAAALEDAFAAFAVTVGAGMLPAFIATPPPGLVRFLELFRRTDRPRSRAEGVERVAGAIDTWMRTGTALPPVPAPQTPVAWS